MGFVIIVHTMYIHSHEMAITMQIIVCVERDIKMFGVYFNDSTQTVCMHNSYSQLVICKHKHDSYIHHAHIHHPFTSYINSLASD